MAITYIDKILEQVPATSTAVGVGIGTVEYAKIVYAACHNESAANVILTVNIVQSGGSAGLTNRYVYKTIPAGKTVVLYEIVGRVMATGDAIYATASAASALNLSIGVKEVTS